VRGRSSSEIARACPVASVLLTAAVLLLLGPGAPDAGAASSPYVDFGRHDTYDALSAAEQDGVTVGGLPSGAGEVSLALPHRTTRSTVRAPTTAAAITGVG
jgi:hypothetical protein